MATIDLERDVITMQTLPVIPIPGLESMTLGEQILVLRHRKGWSQEKLAEEAGVTQRTVWVAERNIEVTQFPTAKKLLAALGWNIEQCITVTPAGPASQAGA